MVDFFARNEANALLVIRKVRVSLDSFNSEHWFIAAVLSRVLIVVLAVIFNCLIVDHFPGADVPIFEINIGATPPVKLLLLKNVLKAFTKWDSAYYLQIARDGKYVIDQQLAFFPLYPFLIRLTSFTLHRMASLYVRIQSTALTLLVYFLSSSYSSENIISMKIRLENVADKYITAIPENPADALIVISAILVCNISFILSVGILRQILIEIIKENEFLMNFDFEMMTVDEERKEESSCSTRDESSVPRIASNEKSGRLICDSKRRSRLVDMAVLSYICNPANIFFSSAYT